MDETLLQTLIAQKYIAVRNHNECDYEILNYTQKTQYDKKWNPVTLACRGLIRNKTTKQIVARGLPKFFNYGEMQQENIPNLPFTVDDKMDGSCGILYWNDKTGLPCIATRGSFESPQALHATDVIQNRYKKLLGDNYGLLRRDVTYVFEIIYPENRIVVDYGKTDDLFLICAFETETGREILRSELTFLPFPHVKSFDGLNDMNEILKIQDPHNEGFVIRFSNGLRVKVKFGEYKRLHRIVTEISSIDIWTNLMEEKDFTEILEKVPDEFFDWVTKTKNRLETAFLEIDAEVSTIFQKFEAEMGINAPRKEAANYLRAQKYTGLLFAKLDGKNYKPKIWELIRPQFEKPFANRDD